MDKEKSEVSMVFVAYAFPHKEAVVVSAQETLAAGKTVKGSWRYILLAVGTVVPAGLSHIR